MTAQAFVLGALPELLGTVDTLLTAAGYFDEANTLACNRAAIEPLLAPEREAHHMPWQKRYADTVRRARNDGRTGRPTCYPCFKRARSDGLLAMYVHRNVMTSFDRTTTACERWRLDARRQA